MIRQFIFCGLFMVGIVCGFLSITSLHAEEEQAAITGVDSSTTLAVMPFFKGKWQPEETEAADQTLGCSLAQICRVDPNIDINADRMVTQLVYDWLKVRLSDRLLPREVVSEAFDKIARDPLTQTPRSLAMELGTVLGADLVLTGTVWRYRARGALEQVPDSPAAVAFAVYLVEVKTGQRIWRGVYDEVQGQVTNNLMQAPQHIKMGIRWLTADEMARQGVQQVFKKFPFKNTE